MAKNEKLSLEDLLEQALVKDGDQPYEVPENWVWTRLEQINLRVSKTLDPKIHPHEYFELYSVPSCEGDYPEILFGEEIGSTKQIVKKNDVLLCKINPRINRVWIVSKHTEFTNIASSEWIVVTTDKLNPKYVMWCLRSKYFREFMLSNVSGVGGSLTRSKPKDVCNYPIPIPPLPEQQRIVNIIESLFGKLDRAKELAQNTLDSFENRKSAILHKAFTGELTRKWREENGVEFDEWREYTINDLVTKLNQGWSPKCENFPSTDYEKWGVIKTTAIQHMDFVEQENKQLPDSLEPREQHELKAGDILVTRAGPRIRVGVCCLVKQVRPRLLLCDKAYRFRANEALVIPEYIVVALNTSDILNEINLMKTGISDSGVNLTQAGFLAIKLYIPTIAEQKEIVRILDNLLENEQKAKELCDVIAKIDHMKKAILARAFRGELSTNNLDEQSALELLKEVLKEKG